MVGLRVWHCGRRTSSVMKCSDVLVISVSSVVGPSTGAALKSSGPSTPFSIF